MRGKESVQLHNQPVGVYYAGQDFAAESPAFSVERHVARQWLREKKAWSIHHGRDIALQPEMEQHLARRIDGRRLIADLLPEASCVMGERVMNANAEEKVWARLMVRSWNPRVALAAHLRSLGRYQSRVAGDEFPVTVQSSTKADKSLET